MNRDAIDDTILYLKFEETKNKQHRLQFLLKGKKNVVSLISKHLYFHLKTMSKEKNLLTIA